MNDEERVGIAKNKPSARGGTVSVVAGMKEYTVDPGVYI